MFKARKSLLTAAGYLYLMAFGVFLPSAANASELTWVNWFQITFGESIKFLSVLPSTAPNTMPAIALAADRFKPDGVIHFYRLDLLSGRVAEKSDIRMSADFPKLAIVQAVLSRDGSRLLIANTTHEVILYDIAAKKVLNRFSGHRQGTTFVEFSHDESKVAAIDEYRNLWIWEVAGDQETPTQVIELPQWAGRVEFFEGDTKLRVYGEETISTYSIAAGRLETAKNISPRLQVDRMHRPETVLFSADGTTFLAEQYVANGDEGAVGRYRRDTGEMVWSHNLGKINPPPGWPVTANNPTGYVLSSNESCLIVGDWGGYRVLDPATGVLKFRQQVNASGYYLRLSLDGKYLLDLGDSNVTVYRLPTECGV